jgi:hypothetical protein
MQNNEGSRRQLLELALAGVVAALAGFARRRIKPAKGPPESGGWPVVSSGSGPTVSSRLTSAGPSPGDLA